MNWLTFLAFLLILPAGVLALMAMNAAADRWGEARVMVTVSVGVWLAVGVMVGVATA